VLDLRLIVITDGALAGTRGVDETIMQALAAGAPAIQLRDKDASPRELLEHARALLPHVHGAGARLFINDRIDIALAAGADGVHLGPHDLPVAAARRIAPPHFLIGYSTDDPAAAARAARDGAAYIGCGAVFGTTTKKDLGDERIGIDRLAAVVRAASIPVVGIGGVTAGNVRTLHSAGAQGAAVAGAVMGAEDVGAAVRALMAGFA